MNRRPVKRKGTLTQAKGVSSRAAAPLQRGVCAGNHFHVYVQTALYMCNDTNIMFTRRGRAPRRSTEIKKPKGPSTTGETTGSRGHHGTGSPAASCPAQTGRHIQQSSNQPGNGGHTGGAITTLQTAGNTDLCTHLIVGWLHSLKEWCQLFAQRVRLTPPAFIR